MIVAARMLNVAMAGIMMSTGGAALDGGAGRPGGGFKLPPSVGRTLGNGMRVYVMEYHELPLVDFEVIVGAGAAHDPPGREGLASLVADLLRKGTTTRSAQEIADAVDFVGGSLGASADQEGTRITAEFLTKDLDLGLDLLMDSLRNPAFASAEIERQKAETISELKASRENPGLLASRRFIEILYGGHPYGHPTPGWESTVAPITRDDVAGFYRDNYEPDGIIFIAVGDFKNEEMMAKLEARLTGWKGKTAPRKAVPAPAKLPARAGRTIYLVDKPDATQSQIRIGGLGIRRVDPDYAALQVANTILGGGFTSRLVEEIRVNRGLSYGVSSRFYPMLQTGPFMINTFTKNPTTLETIKVALEVEQKFLKEGPTAEELDKARKYLKGAFAIGHQAPDAMADVLGEIAFYGLSKDYYDTWLDRIAAVTVDDVKRVTAKFPAEGSILLVLGKAEEIRKDVETLGPVTVVPLSAH
ncbi:MAG TPA: pitrilysin family protein [Patescibacteria group bacterium]|nr:pitrilysin family protein [Patescibacteria group bacterium]